MSPKPSETIASYVLKVYFRINQATGILFTGTGLGGVIMPFVTEILLRRYGHQKTFFILVSDSSSPVHEPELKLPPFRLPSLVDSHRQLLSI